MATFASMQNPTGGFGGGFGQISHAASSYAAVLCLALAGGEDAYRLLDRRAMYTSTPLSINYISLRLTLKMSRWKWLGRIKHSDGGFSVCDGGEKDVR